MSKKVGLWIDHRKAIIVEFEDGEASIKTIESGVEKHVRLSGGSRTSSPFGPQEIVSEGGRERKFRQHLDEYYDRVAASIRDAEAILIFGPGKAKAELKKTMDESKALSKKVAGIETADKMTERQIIAKVKKRFKIED